MTCPHCRGIDRRALLGLLGLGVASALAGCDTEPHSAAAAADHAHAAAAARHVRPSPHPAPTPDATAAWLLVRIPRRSSLAAVTSVAVVAALFGLGVWSYGDMHVNQGPGSVTNRILPVRGVTPGGHASAPPLP
jgi:hypothetical protein